MPKILVKHSCIVIDNYNLGDCPKLEHFFSIYDVLTHRYTYKCLEYIESEKKLILPRGIDIFFLEKLFECTAIIDYKCDEYDYTDPILIKYLPRDDVQKESLRFILGNGAYISNKKRSQLCVNLNTGAGKTYIAIAVFAYECIRSMVITSSIDWLNQWKDKTTEYTDVKEKEIYMISGMSSIAKLLNGMSDPMKYKLFLVSHNTIKSYGDKYGWHKITELFKLLKIALKIYDEAHLNFDNMSKIDFYTNTKLTLYLTATPARSDKDENTIYKLYFKNVPSIDLFDVETDPRTEYIAFHYNSNPTPQEISKCKNQYGLNRVQYTNYVVMKDNFYNILHILIMTVIKKINGKVLIYIGTNNSILIVKEWIVEHYPEYLHNIGIYTSIVTENKENEKNKKIILSTTKSCGAAMDIKDLKLTIVLAEPFKSEVLARQTLGRTRDNNTLYIEVVDNGFYYTRKYYEQKKPIFSKYALSCSDVKFSNSELENKASEVVEDRQLRRYPLYKIGYKNQNRPPIRKCYR